MKKFLSIFRKIKWYKLLLLFLHLLLCISVFCVMTSDFFLEALKTSDNTLRGLPVYDLYVCALFVSMFQFFFVITPALIYGLLLDWCKKDLKNVPNQTN